MKLSEHCRDTMEKLENNNAVLRNKIRLDANMGIRYKQVEAYMKVIKKGNDPTPLEINSCEAALRDIEIWIKSIEDGK